MRQIGQQACSDGGHLVEASSPTETERTGGPARLRDPDVRGVALEQAREADRAWRAGRLLRLRKRIERAPLMAGVIALSFFLLSYPVYYRLRSDNATGDPLSAWETSVRFAPHLLYWGMLFVLARRSERWKKELAQHEAEEKELTQNDADPRPGVRGCLADPPAS